LVKNIYINDVSKYDGKKVLIRGWLYNKRSSGNIVFLLVRDGTGMLQCVVSNKVLVPSQAAGVNIGVSILINPFLSKYSLQAFITSALIFSIACCFLDLSQR